MARPESHNLCGSSHLCDGSCEQGRFCWLLQKTIDRRNDGISNQSEKLLITNLLRKGGKGIPLGHLVGLMVLFLIPIAAIITVMIEVISWPR